MNRKFHKDLFSPESIANTIVAFAHLADISFSETKMYWEVVFTNSKYDIDKTANEFENYLIQLTFMENKKVGQY